MANRNQIQTALHKPYDKLLFAKEVLSPVFGSGFSLSSSSVLASVQPNKSEQAVIDSVSIYGNITLEDNTEITCYEILLQPTVRIEQSKVAIQRYVRKLLTAGQAALVNFVAPQNKNVWRLTLVAKDSELTDEGIKEKTTHAKRYTYLLGPNETCKTAAERFETLSTERQINFQALVNAFSVEKLSKAFFDEYTLHYENFCNYLQESNYRKSVFKVSFPASASKEEKDKACKPIRDFTKKLLGRIVFLYFVQKKGWLGASDLEYKDGLIDFMKLFFKSSGGDETFYSNWLTVLFFETLNKERANDDFKMPDGKKLKVPFLNGGLFDREEHDEHLLTFKAKLFHNPDFEDAILTDKNKSNSRGFLDFLNSFNFTVHEDSPDDHTVAVDPEMLGHIFENLLEDNKDKGAFYTPKEIVHYMCQESLIEYLTTHLSKEFTVYRQIDKEQIEIFGNDSRQGQLKMMVQLGDKALNRDDVAYIVKHKDISQLTNAQLKRINTLLTTVKICDPAIGSGAFPMGLLQEIFAIKEVIAYELKAEWKPADVKENIIQNSVYGVDIEKGAVDIARLRFWLSLVVDEIKPRALPNLDYKIVVGDSLASKFENEIIEIDWERKHSVGKADTFVKNVQQLLQDIATKQKKFFKPETKDKRKLQGEIRHLKLELLINQLSFNREIFLGKNTVKGGFAPSASELKYNAELKLIKKDFENRIENLTNLQKEKDKPFEHFDWKLDFPEILNPYLANGNAGFDIVIANPPYIGQKGNKELFEQFKESTRWKFFYERKQDIYYYFIVQGILLTKQEGNLTYINPPYFLTAAGGKNLREFITKNIFIDKIVNLSETVKVFENASINSLIIFLNKNSSYKNSKIKIFTPNVVSKTSYLTNPKLFTSKFTTEDLSGSEWHIFKDENTIEFKNDDIIPLGSISTISPGIQTGCDKVTQSHLEEYDLKGSEKDDGIFVLSNEEYRNLNLTAAEKKFVKPFFKNSAISKWTYDKNNRHWIIITNNIDNLNSYPNLKRHLSKFKIILDNRYRNFALINADKEGKWWYLYGYRPNTNFNDEKIILPYRAVDNSFAYSSEPFYASIDVFFINVTNPSFHTKYINSILCSKVIEYWLNKNCKRKGKVLELYQKPLSEIPIIQAKEEIQKVFSVICDYILFLKEKIFTNVTDQLMPTYFEQVIDGMVYELYFPEVIGKHKREIIKHLGELPEFKDNMSEDKKVSICKTVFNRLNEREHTVRTNLFFMSSIPEIKIIEGKNENN